MKMKIEFRGKQCQINRWIFGDLIECDDDHIFIFTDEYDNGTLYGLNYGLMIANRSYAVDPKTVGQCTNVNTPSGDKIFQGDVVSVEIDDGQRYGTFIGVVEFLEGMWVVNNRVNDMIPLWSETNEIKILGNIWDNPKLLEVPK